MEQLSNISSLLLVGVTVAYALIYFFKIDKLLSKKLKSRQRTIEKTDKLDELIERALKKEITVSDSQLHAVIDSYLQHSQSPELNKLIYAERKRMVLLYKYALTQKIDKTELIELERKTKQLEERADSIFALV